MRKRYLWGLLVLGGSGLLAGLWPWLTAARHRINRASFALIHVGMTEREVEQVLGVPAGNYSAGKVVRPGLTMWPPDTAALKTWLGTEATIVVRFNDAGLVAAADFLEQ